MGVVRFRCPTCGFKDTEPMYEICECGSVLEPVEEISLEEFEARLKKRTWYDNLRMFWKWRILPVFDVPYRLKKIKWFYQRGKRGYSDEDVWNLFAYLLEMLPQALEDLNRIKHGCPTINEDEDFEFAFRRWGEELQIMIDGFKAAKDTDDLDLEEGIEEYHRKYDEQIAKFDKGMELFHKRFFHLWD